MLSKKLNEPVNSAMVNSWQDMAVRWSSVSSLSEATNLEVLLQNSAEEGTRVQRTAHNVRVRMYP